MSCCPSTQRTFNEAVTVLPFTDAMKLAYSTTPRVSIYYRNDDGSYNMAGVFTLVKVTASQIIVDHGGPARGVIKVD